MLLPLGVLSFALTVGAWAGSLALMGLPFYVSHLPGDTAKFWLFEVSAGTTAIGLALLGLVAFVFAAPWITLGVSALHGALGRGLLGPTGDAELTARVSQLRQAARPQSTARRRSADASNAISTTAPNRGWSPWRSISAPRANAWRMTQPGPSSWSQRPMRRPRQR